MVKQVFTAITAVILLSSCTALKQLNFTSNKQVTAEPESAPKTRFIESIAISHSAPAGKPVNAEKKESVKTVIQQKTEKPVVQSAAHSKPVNVFAARTPEVETATPVQFKYALLLDTEVESLPEKSLLEAVDEWYGVRYRLGGSTKNGVDCSAFTMAVYSAVYGMMLPRVSRDQYQKARKISTTELKEGDLVFFNTRGRGVSHVGIYLGNNKFIHASVSSGVMVSDLFDNYYLRRFIGAGRMDDKQLLAGGH
ncbi:MAG: C40 family peptidase [Chitinophagaceae bacterium]|nr:C40 family peptidase [Chitinophagaceae bacterium]